jgi:hypothetical protein
MYLGTDDSHTRYTRDGQQKHTQGDFLLLLTPESHTVSKDNLRACVRQVALEQVGHFMMGTARIGGQQFSVTGSYGNNGLPMSVPDGIWKHYGVDVPDELYEEWKNGGGHNAAGAEAGPLREWAVEELAALTP